MAPRKPKTIEEVLLSKKDNNWRDLETIYQENELLCFTHVELNIKDLASFFGWYLKQVSNIKGICNITQIPIPDVYRWTYDSQFCGKSELSLAIGNYCYTINLLDMKIEAINLKDVVVYSEAFSIIDDVIKLPIHHITKYLSKTIVSSEKKEKKKNIETEVNRFKYLYVHARLNELGLDDKWIKFFGSDSKSFKIQINMPSDVVNKNAKNYILMSLYKPKVSDYTIEEDTKFCISFNQTRSNTWKIHSVNFDNLAWKNLESIISCFINSYDFKNGIPTNDD